MAKAASTTTLKNGGPKKTLTNSRASFLPLDDGRNDSNGLTKGEFAIIQFVSAHLQAHGKYPDREQLISLGELAVHVLDTIMAIVAPGPKQEEHNEPENE